MLVCRHVQPGLAFYVGTGDSSSGGHGYLISTLTARLTSQPLHLTFERGPEAVQSTLSPIEYMHVCVPFLVTCVKIYVVIMAFCFNSNSTLRMRNSAGQTDIFFCL